MKKEEFIKEYEKTVNRNSLLPLYFNLKAFFENKPKKPSDKDMDEFIVKLRSCLKWIIMYEEFRRGYKHEKL